MMVNLISLQTAGPPGFGLSLKHACTAIRRVSTSSKDNICYYLFKRHACFPPQCQQQTWVMHEVATGYGTSLAGPTIRYTSMRHVVKLYSKHAREGVARAAENTVPVSGATCVRQHQLTTTQRLLFFRNGRKLLRGCNLPPRSHLHTSLLLDLPCPSSFAA